MNEGDKKKLREAFRDKAGVQDLAAKALELQILGSPQTTRYLKDLPSSKEADEQMDAIEKSKEPRS